MSSRFQHLCLLVLLTLLSISSISQNIHLEKKIDSLRNELKKAEQQRQNVNDQIIQIQTEIQKNTNLMASGLRADGRRNVKCNMEAHIMSKPSYHSEISVSIPIGAWLIVDERDGYTGGYIEAEYDGKKEYLYEVTFQNQESPNTLLATPSNSENKSSSSYKGSGNSSAQKRTYFTGPKVGCYYINSSGNKQYVYRSYCR